MTTATNAAAIDVDQISQLPDHIIHCILSLLPTIDVTRVSVLSKVWNGFFTCFPMSDFSDPLADRSCYHLVAGLPKALPARIDDVNPGRPVRMLNFVRKSLLRECRKDSSLPKFRLSIVRHRCNPQIANLTDNCLQLAASYGVKELDLHLGQGYDLPLATFSGNELVVCRLVNCNLHLPLEASVNWPFLRELCLKRVKLDGDSNVFDKLISACPFVEKISLEQCYGLSKCLRLCGFTKLKEVKVQCDSMEKIEIDALCLQAFSFASEWNKGNDTQLDLTSCRNLEVLDLEYRSIEGDSIIEDLIPNFPNVKVLILKAYRSLSIRISSQSLEKLQLHTDFMGSVTIDAPMMQSVKFGFDELMFRSILRSTFSLKKSSLREIAVKLHSKGEDYYDILKIWSQALAKFNKIKLLTCTLAVDYWGGFDYVVTQLTNNNSDRAVFLDIDHLKFNISIDLYDKGETTTGKVYGVIVEGVLRMCHPKCVLFESDLGTSNDEFMKVLCKKLMRSAKHHQNCCAASHLKCWRHDLKGIRIEHFRSDGRRRALACEDLLHSQSVLPNDEIRFLLEWC